MEDEVRKVSRARSRSSLQDEDRSLDCILIVWGTTGGFHINTQYEFYVKKVILAIAQPTYK